MTGWRHGYRTNGMVGGMIEDVHFFVFLLVLLVEWVMMLTHISVAKVCCGLTMRNGNILTFHLFPFLSINIAVMCVFHCKDISKHILNKNDMATQID